MRLCVIVIDHEMTKERQRAEDPAKENAESNSWSKRDGRCHVDDVSSAGAQQFDC